MSYPQEPKVSPPPDTDCLNCHAVISTVDSFCWACGEVYTGHELYDHYIKTLEDARH